MGLVDEPPITRLNRAYRPFFPVLAANGKEEGNGFYTKKKKRLQKKKKERKKILGPTRRRNQAQSQLFS